MFTNYSPLGFTVRNEKKHQTILKGESFSGYNVKMYYTNLALGEL